MPYSGLKPALKFESSFISFAVASTGSVLKFPRPCTADGLRSEKGHKEVGFPNYGLAVPIRLPPISSYKVGASVHKHYTAPVLSLRAVSSAPKYIFVT
jgi:hypothetical protein